jgi:hypothetical protein
LEDPVAIFVVQVGLNQVVLILDDQPLFCPVRDVQLLAEARNFSFGISDGLLQIYLSHICDFEFQLDRLDDEDLSLCSVIFEVLVNHVDLCSSWFIKTLEFTFAVYGSQRLKLFSQLPEVLA